MKIVLDTNVYISSIVFKGICREVFVRVIEMEDCFISPFILQELSKKLTSKFLFSKEQCSFLESDLLKVFILMDPHTKLPSVCRDVKDNNIFQLAESTNADYLITGDKDLLVLNNYLKTSILSPSIYLQKLLNN